MKKWNYKLEEEGKELRKLIDEEKPAEIIEQLQKCYNSLSNLLSEEDKEYYESDIEDAMNLIEGEADIIRNNPEELEDFGFENVEELVDERLREFYDICDNARVWIQL